jgi:uncharacterized protein (TIGR02453 family)
MLQSSTIKFLKDLKKNNNKPWFEAHRPVYENARKDFEIFIQSVIDQHGKKDPSIKNLVARNCMFRINRDVRFSKDKSPYKFNFGASINPGGKKSPLAGYYFHLSPGDSFAGGGIWMPLPGDLKKIRQEIDYNLAAFKKILAAKKFKSVYGDLSRDPEYLLSRVPKGYEPGNPAAAFLKLKSLIAGIPLKDVELSAKDLLKKTAAAFDALQPLIEFINESIS